jgi:spore coat polysaccharide biosynthesis protein SpsF (cytidylyltransferase family)
LDYILVQARSSSSRLYNKIFLKFYKLPLIIFLYKRIKSNKYKIYFLISNDSSDDYLAYLLQKYKINFFRGNLQNVKKRFTDFIKKIPKNSTIVRLTADNPLIDKYLIEYSLNLFRKNIFKYTYVDTDNQFIPYGISIEVFKAIDFKKKFKNKNLLLDSKEHVTSDFEKLKENKICVNSLKKKIRVSIDYFSDYINLKKVILKFTNPLKIGWYSICKRFTKFHNISKSKKNISCNSVLTKNLTKNNINEIISLKRSFWKYSVKSTKRHFEINYKKNDSHNLVYLGKELIGYSAFRKNLSIFDCKKNYMILDNVIIKNKYQNFNLSDILMSFNNNFIISKKKETYLICKKELVNFYKKYYWKSVNNKYIKLRQHQDNKKYIMSFDFRIN